MHTLPEDAAVVLCCVCS